jgi:hypothetical protein
METLSIRAAIFAFTMAILGACHTTSAVSGTWTGTLDSPNKIGVRFVLTEQNGKIEGRSYWQNEDTKDFEPEGELSGTWSDSAASWVTDGEVQVVGTFNGNSFSGTLTFPAIQGVPARSAKVELSR